MAFSDFKVMAEVANKYNIVLLQKTDIFKEVSAIAVSPAFTEDIDFCLRLRKSNASEYFLGESFVFRTFLEALKQNPKINFWSHEYTLTASGELTGIPDYLISFKKKNESYENLQLPFVAVGDAKKEDFAGGWAQTLAEMIACQQLNKEDNMPIWGIVTTGTTWEFGRLEGNSFTLNLYSYSIGANTTKIAGILDYIFKEGIRCAEEVES